MTAHDIHIIGGGLAGSEAAWQLAEAGLKVRLSEMRGANLPDGGESTPAHETDQLAGIVGAEKFAAIEVRPVLLLDCIEIVAVMPELPALTNRCLVVDCLDACGKAIIESRRSDLDSLLRRAPRVLARLLGKPLPPSLVVVSSNHRHIVNFELTVSLDGRAIDRP